MNQKEMLRIRKKCLKNLSRDPRIISSCRRQLSGTSTANSGILDWEGGNLTQAEQERFKAHYVTKDEVTDTKVTKLPFGMVISVTGKGATMSSELVQEFADQDTEGPSYAKTAANAMESLLVALAAAGVDMADPRIAEAVNNAVEAVSQNLDDEPEVPTVAVFVDGGLIQNVVSNGKVEVIKVDTDLEGIPDDDPSIFIYKDSMDDEVEAYGGREFVERDDNLIQRIVEAVDADPVIEGSN